MPNSFDQIIDRLPSHANKYAKYANQDVIPMWVADTDFLCAPQISNALAKRVEHGIFGYTNDWPELNASVQNWMQQRYDWRIEPDWIVWLPGVVPGFNAACRAFTQPGDALAVQVPNYPPLKNCASLHGLESFYIDSVIDNDRWVSDWQQLEQAIAQPSCTLLMLCNPMNPCGSVLSESELQYVVDLCERHDVLLCSDEIHCDLILDPGIQHTPAGKLNNRTITLMAASKTFNVAGLNCSFAIIPDADLRQQYKRGMSGLVGEPNLLGMVATEAAFTHGEVWRREQLDYLRGNRDLITERLKSIPGISGVKPEATYLYWLDAGELQVDDAYQFFLQAGVAPSPGEAFGDAQFVRLNFGCPRTVLESALDRIEHAVRSR